jgi:MFS family permease
VRGDLVLRPLFTGLMAFVVVGEATNVVEVFLVRDSLHGSDTAYGLIGMAAASGVAVGSLLGGRDATTARRLRWIVLAAGVLAVCLVAAGLAPTLLVVAAAWALLGVANGVLNTATSTLLMTRVPDASRGQVIAALMGATRGFSLGALALGGLAAGAFGPRATFVVSGVLALAVTLMLAVRADLPDVRHEGPGRRAERAEGLPAGGRAHRPRLRPGQALRPTRGPRAGRAPA